ncbi:hypothetical protein PSEUDO9AG_40974 [Pseudomonas sp. 9Ag]|nr:hypothetical protein PSEUDO9AG_40974 [Pseudomonas sp. 9Ag]
MRTGFACLTAVSESAMCPKTSGHIRLGHILVHPDPRWHGSY